MLGAIAALQDEGSSANQATKQLGVLSITLKDRLSGHVVHGTKPVCVPHLHLNKRSWKAMWSKHANLAMKKLSTKSKVLWRI